MIPRPGGGPLRRLAPIAAAIGLLSPAAAQETACGPDAPCEVEGGSYHLRVPEGWDGESPLPVLVFFHGHRGSGDSIFRSKGLRRDFSEAGYLLVAPNGAIRPGTDYRAWPARPDAGPRDDVAFTLAVLDDVAARLPLDEARVHASGFSAGGSMAWMMGCHAAERIAGVASVAGALREPHPEACDGPVPVIQIHGFTDVQVPLEGRGIRDWHQGSVFDSLDLARSANGCRTNPDEITLGEPFRCRVWNASCEAAPVALCLHDGGHGLPPGWTETARDFLEGAAR